MTRSWRISRKEFDYVSQVLESGFPGAADVSFVAKLERAFGEKFNCQYAISHTNGTATLHAALAAVGVTPGDEVIVPPLDHGVNLAGRAASMRRARLRRHRPRYLSHRSRKHPRPHHPSHASHHHGGACTVCRPTWTRSWSWPSTSAGRDRGRRPVFPRAATKAEWPARSATWPVSASKTRNTLLAAKAAWSRPTTSDMPIGSHGLPAWDTVWSRAGAGKSKIDKRAILHPSFKRHVSFGYNYRMSELCAAVRAGPT